MTWRRDDLDEERARRHWQGVRRPETKQEAERFIRGLLHVRAKYNRGDKLDCLERRQLNELRSLLAQKERPEQVGGRPRSHACDVFEEKWVDDWYEISEFFHDWRDDSDAQHAMAELRCVRKNLGGPQLRCPPWWSRHRWGNRT